MYFPLQAGDGFKVMRNSTESTLQWKLTLMGMIDLVQIPISVAVQLELNNNTFFQEFSNVAYGPE